MPWKVTDAMSLRLELVNLMQRDGANVSELCRRFGISRNVAYKWLRRAQSDKDLADRLPAADATRAHGFVRFPDSCPLPARLGRGKQFSHR